MITEGVGPGGTGVPIQATATGALKVSESGGDAGTADLLGRLVWELAELRRVYCEATDQAYLEYPGDGTDDAL